jgi:hypothetical protein
MTCVQGKIIIDIGTDEPIVIKSPKDKFQTEEDINKWIREEYKNLPFTYRELGKFYFFMRRVYEDHKLPIIWHQIYVEGLN